LFNFVLEVAAHRAAVHGRTWPGPSVASATPAQTQIFFFKMLV